jgi:hypothetical protein
MFLMVRELAGQETTVNATVVAILQALGRLSVDRWAAWLVATLFGGAYLRRRHIHLKDKAEKSRYIRELEARLDPDRTASGLTDGEQRPAARSRQ